MWAISGNKLLCMGSWLIINCWSVILLLAATQSLLLLFHVFTEACSSMCYVLASVCVHMNELNFTENALHFVCVLFFCLPSVCFPLFLQLFHKTASTIMTIMAVHCLSHILTHTYALPLERKEHLTAQLEGLSKSSPESLLKSSILQLNT